MLSDECAHETVILWKIRDFAHLTMFVSSVFFYEAWTSRITLSCTRRVEHAHIGGTSQRVANSGVRAL